MINVFHHLGFWDKSMYTMGQNNSLWPIAMNGMDGYGCIMMNVGYFASLCNYGGNSGFTPEKNKNLGFLGLGTYRFGEKSPVTCVCWVVEGMMASASSDMLSLN